MPGISSAFGRTVNYAPTVFSLAPQRKAVIERVCLSHPAIRYSEVLLRSDLDLLPLGICCRPSSSYKLVVDYLYNLFFFVEFGPCLLLSGSALVLLEATAFFSSTRNVLDRLMVKE